MTRISKPLEVLGCTKPRQRGATGKPKDAAPSGSERSELLTTVGHLQSATPKTMASMPEPSHNTKVAEETQPDNEPVRAKGREWHTWGKQHDDVKKDLRMDAQGQERRERNLRAARKPRSRSDFKLDKEGFSIEVRRSREKREGKMESDLEEIESKRAGKDGSNKESKETEAEKRNESEEIAMKEM